MLKRIAVKNLRLGMFITELCGSAMHHPFAKTKFILDNISDLDSIRKSDTKEVWIDTAKGHDEEPDTEHQPVTKDIETKTPAENIKENKATTQKAENIQKTEHLSLDSEIKTAVKICARAKEAVINIFNEARMGKAIELDQAQEMVEEISNSVMRQPHALISLARLKNSDEYTYMHSVAVCALMIALARQMKLSEHEIREAGLAGLLHDIGKIGIPLKILNKPGKLTDDEFTTIKKHPEIGSTILLDNPLISLVVQDVVLHHHEKTDGSGYPHGLKGENISLFAKMGAVCDIYDATTSNRPYKKAWLPAESIRKMSEWCSGHLDEKVFQTFVKTVGIYPTGSLVRLESGRLGVVTEQHESSLLTPKVKVFFSAKFKAPIMQETIDLSTLIGKEKIVGREAVEDWGFRNLDALWSGL